MAITKLQSESLNLADDYTFTGEVTADPIKLSPIVSVQLSGNQTTSDNVLTLLNFNTEDVDTDNAFDNTSGNYKFTVPSGKAGKYMVTLMLTSFNEGSDIIIFQGYIYKNGSAVAYQRQRHDDGSSSPARHEGLTAHWLGDLAEGDYVQFYTQLDVSSNDAVIQGGTQSRATIVRLGS